MIYFYLTKKYNLLENESIIIKYVVSSKINTIINKYNKWCTQLHKKKTV